MNRKERRLAVLLGRRIRAARSARGDSQETCARRAKTRRAVWYRLERGKALPNVRTLLRAADALGVPVRDFFAEKESK